MSDRILLRTLTFKSKLGFGDSEELTVNDAIELDYQYKLINAYYYFSKITFTDAVLDKLGITKENRISKPGKDEALGDKVLRGINISKGITKKNVYKKLFAKAAVDVSKN